MQGVDALAEALDNLLINAVEHNTATEPRVHVGVETAGETVIVRIADNGPGIPDDRKAALFEPPENGDDGMGLYLARTVIAHCGGDIWVEDNDPSGTVFKVTLPRVNDDHPQQDQQAGREAEPRLLP